jgi:hypothetical protein
MMFGGKDVWGGRGRCLGRKMKMFEEEDVCGERISVRRMMMFGTNEVKGKRCARRKIFEENHVWGGIYVWWGGRCLGFVERDFWKEKCVLGVQDYINGKVFD